MKILRNCKYGALLALLSATAVGQELPTELRNFVS